MTAKTERLEWIGVSTLMTDDQMSFARTAGQLGPYGEATVEAIDIILAPFVVKVGSTQRVMGPVDGLTETYAWGLDPGSYIQPMKPIDAERILAGPNGAEFRREGDFSKVPVLPRRVLTKTLLGIMKAVESGTPFYTNEPAVFTDPEGLLKQYERAQERQGELREIAAWNAKRHGLDSRPVHLQRNHL